MRKIFFYFFLFTLIITKSWADVYQVKTEQIMFSVLIDGKNYRLEAMCYKPLDNKTQHSLIIMTHGRDGTSPDINEYEALGYRNLNRALAEKGYLVMMLVRRGYGNSQGPDSELLNTPEDSAMAAAKDIKSAVEFMNISPDIIKDNIIAMGQSCGGWAVLALSTMNIKGLKGVVNISGATVFTGTYGNNILSLEYNEKLNKSAEIFGKSSRIPSLWIYAENDKGTSIDWLYKRFNLFQKGGNIGQLVIKAKNNNEGHYIYNEPDRFMDDLIKFFKEIGF